MYSLRDVVTDGPLTAPRWLQHLVKVCVQHTTPAYILAAIFGHPIAIAIAVGPVAWLVFALRELVIPSDPQPLTFVQHLTDWLTDLSLATVPVVLALIPVGWPPAGALFGLIFTLYVLCHAGARP
jgi:hypothetical protein